MHAVPWFLALLLAQTPPEAPSNPVFAEIQSKKIALDGTALDLPAPILADGADAAAGHAALLQIVGNERAVADFTRNSVTAPIILRTHDTKAGSATIRSGDLYFVVHADLDALDIRRALGQGDEATTEAGNMRFTTRTLKDADLGASRADRLPAMAGRDEWFAHATGTLLDRIRVESTSRTVATRSVDSWVLATRTDPRFDADPQFPNRWATLTRTGTSETLGPPRPYAGGASYVKATRLAAVPGALLVESHFAFVEPTAWFDGNPILRSKFGPIAQDQVRQLRREIAKRQAVK